MGGGYYDRDVGNVDDSAVDNRGYSASSNAVLEETKSLQPQMNP